MDRKDTYFFGHSIKNDEKNLFFDSPKVMGILNATADSFFDGGRYNSDDSFLAQAEKMISQGADILDIGVVSTRPGAHLLAPEEEAPCLRHFVSLLRSHFPHLCLSIDTCYALPAREGISAGADIINDISGGQFDPLMFPTVAQLGVPYILMHNIDTPDLMQRNPHYNDITQDIGNYFEQKINILHSLGVRQIILDPGFGFGKTLDHNYQLFAHLPQLRQRFADYPFLVALSRKSMIYNLLNSSPDEALSGTIALNMLAFSAGADIVRVHDVLPAVESASIWKEIQKHK